MKIEKLPPMIRRMVEAAQANGYIVAVYTERRAGKVPRLMFALNGRPRKPLEDVFDDLKRIGAA